MSAAAVLAGPAHALLILPTFDASLANSANAAAVEAAINTAASTISKIYSNPGTVQILFEYNSGVLGQSQNGESFAPYAQYVAQMTAKSAANPSNTVLATAVANISKGNGATATYLLGTTAFMRVGMGFTGNGTTPCYNSSGNFVSSCNSVFDAIITLGNVSTTPGGVGQNSQAVSVAEHEIDEVLGSGGTGTTVGESQATLASFLPFPANQQSQFIIGPMDPYRYHSATSTCAGVTTTPSFTTSSSEVACYSIDGGMTSLVQMNQAGGGSDYGDFASGIANIQDAFYPGATPVYSYNSPEVTILESIGANAPEPSSLALIATAMGGIGWVRRRRAHSA